MLKVNPLGKVPSLELDTGEIIYDSRIIIDYIDHHVPASRRMIPVDPDQRYGVLRVEAIALGLAEKCYERGIEYARRNPDKIDVDWSNRLHIQISSGLRWLESLRPDPWLNGNRMSIADITCAIAFTFLREKQQISVIRGDFPWLDKHCDNV